MKFILVESLDESEEHYIYKIILDIGKSSKRGKFGNKSVSIVTDDFNVVEHIVETLFASTNGLNKITLFLEGLEITHGKYGRVVYSFPDVGQYVMYPGRWETKFQTIDAKYIKTAEQNQLNNSPLLQYYNDNSFIDCENYLIKGDTNNVEYVKTILATSPHNSSKEQFPASVS